MANKLYPPYIEGTLPAFFLDYDSSKKIIVGAKITVPFQMNSTVGEAQIKGFSLRMRTTSTGSYLFAPIFSSNYNISEQKVDFYLNAKEAAKLNEGQYYKVQIAYCENVVTSILGTSSGDGIGFYSTVGVIKCTSNPKIRINNLDESSTNFFVNDFIGIYDQTDCKDQTEKVYSYEFVVYNENNEQVYTTGEQLHHSFYDTEYDFSIDKVSINNFVPENKTYSIQYKVTTINNLQLITPKYKITNENLVSPNEEIQIIPIANEDDGTITVTLKGQANKDRSYYFLLDRNMVSDYINDMGLYIQDSSFQTIFTLLQESLEEYPNQLVTFLKNNTLFKRQLSNDGMFLYTICATDQHFEEDPNYIQIGERLCDIIKTIKYSDSKNYDFTGYDLLREEPYEKFYYGSYLLSRADDSDNYSTWVNLGRFKLDEKRPSDFSLKDFTIEHGRKYKYALQQYNIWGLFSSRFYSNIVEANFEDMYLYDGEKTLKIRYNPQVSTFKTTILESKSNTIGGRFPFITRNGETYYKEFPISGLLAQELDIDNSFSDFYYGKAHRHSTSVDQENDIPENAFYTNRDFTDTNIALQRQFKLNVLDWLNNGKPKLFKSPYEGNYIVRLMQNSMTPIKELGRLLHNFTSMAYEIADFNYENLIKFGFIHAEAPSDYVGLWKTFNFMDYDSINQDIEIVFDQNLIAFTIQDMIPGDKIYLKYYGEQVETSIMIGITGSYNYTGSDKTIVGIRIPRAKDGHKILGVLNCYYKGVRITAFDSIIGMQLKTIPSQQFIGVSPYLVSFKNDTKYEEVNNLEVNQFALDGGTFQELQAYNFRDKLNDCTKMTGSGEYRIIDGQMFKDAVEAFDPENILDRINLTLNSQDVYKIQLLNIEQAKFRLREIIPVYAYGYGKISDEGKENGEFIKFHSYDPQNKNNSLYTDFAVNNNKKKSSIFLLLDAMSSSLGNNEKSYPLNGQKKDYYNLMKSDYHFYVSMSPFGYPFPIEELQQINLLDPYAIFEVFYKTADLNDWQSYIPQKMGNETEYIPNTYYIRNSDTGEYELSTEDTRPESFYRLNTVYRYYDPYYRTWLVDDYKPTFTINNSGPISLATVKEKFYKNADLKNINSITIGNGIIAELTFQIKIMDYYTEIGDLDTKAAKDAYIAARDLYNSLLKSYSIIANADYERIKNQALMRIYYELLFGAGTAHLNDTNRDTINTILNNQTEKDNLNLLKLYKITYINKDLDTDIVEDLVSYKNKHILEEHFGFNDNMLVYQKIDENNISEIHFLQSDDLKIFNENLKLTTKDNFDKNDFVVYLQSDTFDNIIFFAIPKIINNNLLLQSPYYYNSEEGEEIQFTNKNDNNTIVYQLSLIDDYASTETKEELLSTEEYKLIKENRYYLYDQLVTYEISNPIAFFEEESIYDLIKVPDANGENGPILTEGVYNKLIIVNEEIDQFNSLISELEEAQESEISDYKDKYIAAIELIDNYNQKVYYNWSVYKVIDLLLNYYRRVGENEEYNEYEDYYIKNDNNEYVKVLEPIDLTTKEYYRHYNRADIIATFSQNANDINNNLDNQKVSVQSYSDAATSIYNNTLTLLENIMIYDKITNDRNDDSNLDDYFNEQIELDRGKVLFNALVLYNYINIIQSISDLTETEQELFNTIKKQYIYLIKAIKDEESVEYFINGFKRLGQNIYNTYISKYTSENTYVATDGIGKRGVAGLTNMIDMSRAYDDLMLICKYVNDNTFTAIDNEPSFIESKWTDILYFIFNVESNEALTTQLNLLVDPINKFAAEIDSYTPSNITNFNISKDVYNYKHRKELNLSFINNSDINDIPPNPLKTFLFNPISEIVKDPLIENENYENNKQYFDSIDNINIKTKILELNLSLILNILEIIEDTGSRLSRQIIAQNLYEKNLREDSPYNSYALAKERYRITKDKDSALVALNGIIASAEEFLSENSTTPISILEKPIQVNGKWSIINIPECSRDYLKIPDGIVETPYLDVINSKFDNKLYLLKINKQTFENSSTNLNTTMSIEEKDNIMNNSINLRKLIYNFTNVLTEKENAIKNEQSRYNRIKELYESKKGVPNYYDGPKTTESLSTGENAILEKGYNDRIKITNTKITINSQYSWYGPREYDIWYSTNEDDSNKQKVTENGIYDKSYNFYYLEDSYIPLTESQLMSCGELQPGSYKFKNTSPVTEYYIDGEENGEPIKIQCNLNTEYPPEQTYYHYIYVEDIEHIDIPVVAEILNYKQTLTEAQENLIKEDNGLLIDYLMFLKTLKTQYENIIENNTYKNWLTVSSFTFPFITTLEETLSTRTSRELESVMLGTYNYSTNNDLISRFQYLSNFFKNQVIFYFKDNSIIKLGIYNNVTNKLDEYSISNLKVLLPNELTENEYTQYYNNFLWYNYNKVTLNDFLDNINTNENNLKQVIDIINLFRLDIHPIIIPQSLILNEDDLLFVTKVLDNMELDQQGVFYEYLQKKFIDKLDTWGILLKQAAILRDLYQKQYDNYNEKYSEYNKNYTLYQDIYNSYIGSKELEFYLGGSGVTLEDQQLKVKKAWWNFLNILDYAYTQERARGLYQ